MRGGTAARLTGIKSTAGRPEREWFGAPRQPEFQAANRAERDASERRSAAADRYRVDVDQAFSRAAA
jgi:hypothetical protein